MATDKDGLFRRGRIFYTWVRGERVSCRTSDRKAAKLFKAKLERAAADPTYLAANETTFGDAVRAFLKDFKTRKRTKHTLTMYEKKCGHLVRIIGADTRLADVNAEAIDVYRATRNEEGAAGTTLGKDMTALRQTLLLAKRHGKYPYDLDQVMPIGASLKYKPRERALTWQEVEALLVAVAQFSMKHARMLAFIVATGARKSEAEMAQAGDIDWERRVVLIRGQKTEESWDEVPILGHPAPIEFLLSLSQPTEFGVWTNMIRDLAAACRRAKIAKVTANDLRRTTATLLRRAGASTDMIARMLRHADSRMVERVYGRVKAEDAGRVLAVQIQHSTNVFTTPTDTKEPETQCPGTELNRRHEDFQANGGTPGNENLGENGSVASADVSSASVDSSSAPSRYRPVGARAIVAGWGSSRTRRDPFFGEALSTPAAGMGEA